MTQYSESVDPTQAENWFVATADNGTVEYCLDDLIPAIKARRISTHNLVWRQGMSDWLEIEQVPLLRMVTGAVETEQKGAAPVETKPEQAALILEPAPAAGKVEAVSNYPVLDEFEATVIQPRLDLLDDNAWTIEPKPKSGKAIAQPVSVIQPEPDLLDDNSWTIEPKAKPSNPIAQSSLGIHELVKRGATPLAPLSQSPTSKLPARPALVRPATTKFNYTKNPPPRLSTSASLQEVQTEPALQPVPQVPSSPIYPPAAPNTPPPAEIAPAPRLASKAPPKPRSSTNPPAPEAPHAKPQPPLPVKASTNSRDSLAANESSLPAPPVASAPSEQTISKATQYPIKSVTAAREIPQTPAHARTVPPSLAQAVASTSTQSTARAPTRPLVSTAVQSLASASTQVPTSNAAPLPAVVHPSDTSQAPYSTSATQDSAEAIGSLIPSVSTVYPDMPEWRKSRRPLVLASGAAVAIAAAIFISIGGSHKKAGPLRPVSARITAAAASELPLAEPSAAQMPPDTAAPQAPPVRQAAQERKAAPPSAKSSERAIAREIAPPLESARSARKQARESDNPFANRQVSEPKASKSEPSASSKPAAPSTKKDNTSSSSIASWDQGTVENRAWMNPGF